MERKGWHSQVIHLKGITEDWSSISFIKILKMREGNRGASTFTQWDISSI